MDITAEEKLMYSIMKAIYESNIPVSFKGSMVLRACLINSGYTEETRHTVDIDANWNSDTPPTTEKMADSLQKAISRYNESLTVGISRPYGERRSAGFEIKNRETDEILFTMDIDVNRPVPPTKIYEIESFRFCGVTLSQMTADKICSVSSDSIFRRIKDVTDLYYISKITKLDKTDILNTLRNGDRKLGNFHAFLSRTDELKHSYDKFRFEGRVTKPSFETVYSAVKTFIADILPDSGKQG